MTFQTETAEANAAVIRNGAATAAKTVENGRPITKRLPTLVAIVVAAAAVVTLFSFGHGARGAESPAQVAPTTSGVAAVATRNTSTTSGSTATPAIAVTRVPSAVAALQQRLTDLGYDPGPADGVAGPRLADAVMAFQKIEGLTRTGRVSSAVTDALATATRPKPIAARGAATRVEISLALQVLQIWKDGELVQVLPVSTGSGRRYCAHGSCEQAITPVGQFVIDRKIVGPHIGPLGVIYWPIFFHNGVAIHGYPSVPATAASHGCVRVPMWAAPGLFDRLPVGTPIYVA